MKPKNYIALFLVFLFLGKLVSVDAKAYTLLLESNGISLVNKYCDHGKFMDASKEQNLQEAEQHLILQMDFLCQAPVELTFSEWQPLLLEDNFKEHNYRDPGFLQVHSDRFYPPPRV